MNDTSHLDLFAVLSSRTPLLQLIYIYAPASQPARLLTAYTEW